LRYRRSVTYDDRLTIRTWIKSLRKRVLVFAYLIQRSDDGRIVAEGETQHLVVDRSGKPISMPERYFRLMQDGQTNECRSGCPIAKLPIFYSQNYDLNLGPHIFPSQKYRLIYRQLLDSGDFSAEDFIPPQPATDEQLLLVHNREYLRKVRTGDFTLRELMRMEIRFSPELAKACLLSAGGTIQACERALLSGISVNLGADFIMLMPRMARGSAF